jgi:hypothetical protein
MGDNTLRALIPVAVSHVAAMTIGTLPMLARMGMEAQILVTTSKMKAQRKATGRRPPEKTPSTAATKEFQIAKMVRWRLTGGFSMRTLVFRITFIQSLGRVCT